MSAALTAHAPADAPLLLRSDAGGIATLTLNRPPARNALSIGLMAALQDALDAIARGSERCASSCCAAPARPSAPATTSRRCAPIPAASARGGGVPRLRAADAERSRGCRSR